MRNSTSIFSFGMPSAVRHFLILLLCAFGSVSGIAQVTIGGANYTSLSSAVSAANPGDNITVTANISEAATVQVNKAVAIDGGGFTLTSASGSYGIHVTVANVTIFYITVTGAESSASRRMMPMGSS